jgi:hypothetical protein
VLIAQPADMDHAVEEWWTHVAYTVEDRSIVGVSTPSAYYRLNVSAGAVQHEQLVRLMSNAS